MRSFKEDFEDWYLNGENSEERQDIWFDELPESMKWGVYQDFFDEMEKTKGEGILGKVGKGWERYFLDFRGRLTMYASRSEARKAALEAAIKIYENNE